MYQWPNYKYLLHGVHSNWIIYNCIIKTLPLYPGTSFWDREPRNLNKDHSMIIKMV